MTKAKVEVTGDGGAMTMEHERAIDRMENMAVEFELEESGALVASVTAFLLEQIKSRPKPWSASSQGEQQDVFRACEHGARELVRKVVEAVARDKKEPIRALLEGYTEKDGVKATIKIKAHTPEEEEAAIIGLHRGVGKHILITIASVDDYNEQGAVDPSEPDQQGLGFEAGTDEAPITSTSHLENAAIDEALTEMAGE